jgi:hypothetical protein
MLDVMLLTTFQHVLVLQDSQGILSQIADKLCQKHHLKLILADHLLVVQTASVEHQTIMLCVRASKAI